MLSHCACIGDYVLFTDAARCYLPGTNTGITLIADYSAVISNASDAEALGSAVVSVAATTTNSSESSFFVTSVTSGSIIVHLIVVDQFVDALRNAVASGNFQVRFKGAELRASPTAFQPPNLCLANNGGCGYNSTCSMTGPTANSCVCNIHYYSPSNSNDDCTPLNNCAVNNGGCDQVCIFLGAGLSRCDCGTNFTISGTNSSACTPTITPSSSAASHSAAVIGGAVGGAILLVTILALVLVIVSRRAKSKSKDRANDRDLDGNHTIDSLTGSKKIYVPASPSSNYLKHDEPYDTNFIISPQYALTADVTEPDSIILLPDEGAALETKPIETSAYLDAYKSMAAGAESLEQRPSISSTLSADLASDSAQLDYVPQFAPNRTSDPSVTDLALDTRGSSEYIQTDFFDDSN